MLMGLVGLGLNEILDTWKLELAVDGEGRRRDIQELEAFLYPKSPPCRLNLPLVI